MKRSYVALALVLGLLTGLLQSVGRTHDQVCAGPAGFEACIEPEAEADDAPVMPQAESDAGVQLEALADTCPRPVLDDASHDMASDEEVPPLAREACFGYDAESAGADSQAAQAAIEQSAAQAAAETSEFVDPYAQYRRYTGYPRYVDGGHFGDNSAEVEESATIDQRTAEIMAEVNQHDTAVAAEVPLNQCLEGYLADDVAEAADEGDCDAGDFNCYEYKFAGKTVVDAAYADYCRRQGGPDFQTDDAVAEAPSPPIQEAAEVAAAAEAPAQPYGEEGWYAANETAEEAVADAPAAGEGCHRYGYECYGYDGDDAEYGDESADFSATVRTELDAAVETSSDDQAANEEAVRDVLGDERHSVGQHLADELNAENDGLSEPAAQVSGVAVVVLPEAGWSDRLARRVTQAIENHVRSLQTQAEDMLSAVVIGAESQLARRPEALEAESPFSAEDVPALNLGREITAEEAIPEVAADSISPEEAAPAEDLPLNVEGPTAVEGDVADDSDVAASADVIDEAAAQGAASDESAPEMPAEAAPAAPAPSTDVDGEWPSYDPEAYLGL